MIEWRITNINMVENRTTNRHLFQEFSMTFDGIPYIQGMEFLLSNSRIFQVFKDAYELCLSHVTVPSSTCYMVLHVTVPSSTCYMLQCLHLLVTCYSAFISTCYMLQCLHLLVTCCSAFIYLLHVAVPSSTCYMLQCLHLPVTQVRHPISG